MVSGCVPDRIQGCWIERPGRGPRTREFRLGTADPPDWPLIRSPAQPSKGDTGVGGPQGRRAPPSAVALRAILDLRPPPCPATCMVGTEGWSLRSNIGIGNIGKPRWKTLDIKSPIQGGVQNFRTL